MLLIAAAIVVAVQGLGNLLVVALLVAPAASGAAGGRPRGADDGRCRRRSRSSPGCAGLYLSYHAEHGGGRVDRGDARRRLPGRRRRPPRCGPGAPEAGLPSNRWPRTGPITRCSTLAGAGYRRGGARTAVVEMLGRQTCAVSARDIDDALRDEGRVVGRASVYRTLETLAELKLVQRLDLGQRRQALRAAPPERRAPPPPGLRPLRQRRAVRGPRARARARAAGAAASPTRSTSTTSCCTARAGTAGDRRQRLDRARRLASGRVRRRGPAC